MLLNFIKEHSKTKKSNQFLNLLEDSKNNDSIVLTFHTLLENQFSFDFLKDVIEYDSKGKYDILKDENTFKWACAFGNPEIINYLHDKVIHKNIYSSITASIMQNVFANLTTLNELGYEKDIFIENNILTAIDYSQIPFAKLNILEYFFENKDKWVLSDCIKNKLTNLHLHKLSSMVIQQPNLFNYIIHNNSHSDIIEKEIPYILDILIKHNKPEQISNLLNSTYKNIITQYFNNPQKIISNLYLDFTEQTNIYNNEKTLNKLIQLYPEYIKKESFKLWMIDSQTTKLKNWIENFRTIKKSEIKKSFIVLSNDLICFNYLLENFSYQNIKFTLSDSISILNNVFKHTKQIKSDYQLNSSYLNFGRQLLLTNNHFENNKNLIKTSLLDEKLFDFLEKESQNYKLLSKLNSHLIKTKHNIKI